MTTIVEVIVNPSNLYIDVITQQPLTVEEINSFVSVPSGGTTGQVLTKNSNANYDLTWEDGSGAPTAPPAAIVASYTTSQSIGGHIVVCQTSGGLEIASSDNISHANRVVGVTTGATASGGTAPIILSGEITEPTWTFSEGLAVYLSTNGTLTQTPPVSGFILQMGVAMSPTTVNISIKLPIIL